MLGRMAMARASLRLPMKHQGQTVSEMKSICITNSLAKNLRRDLVGGRNGAHRHCSLARLQRDRGRDGQKPRYHRVAGLRGFGYEIQHQDMGVGWGGGFSGLERGVLPAAAWHRA